MAWKSLDAEAFTEDGGLGMAPRWTWLAPVDLIGFKVVGGLDR